MKLVRSSTRAAMCALPGFAFVAVLATAQTPPRHAPVAASGPIVSFAATTANVAGAPDSIRIDLLRWSTDAEREQLISAWKMAGKTGRGGRGRGGRGRVADAESADGEAPPPTPESTLTVALKQASTVGYLWSSEVAGYALRYAGHVAGADGSERIVLITDRRLGKTNDLWTPVGSGAPATRDFSVIELRLNSAGEGAGKISLSGNVALDGAARMVVPENYDALPVALKTVKHRIEGAK